MLQECRSITNLRYAPWLFSSAVLVLITILAFNFVGDGLRDAVDPYATI
jgi:peptide/nickel transport system permease protein